MSDSRIDDLNLVSLQFPEPESRIQTETPTRRVPVVRRQTLQPRAVGVAIRGQIIREDRDDIVQGSVHSGRDW